MLLVLNEKRDLGLLSDEIFDYDYDNEGIYDKLFNVVFRDLIYDVFIKFVLYLEGIYDVFFIVLEDIYDVLF